MFACLFAATDTESWLTHTLTGMLSACAGLISAYAYFRRQMVAIAKANTEVNRAQAEVDAAESHTRATEESAASSAWRQLFQQCEAERTEMKAEIAALRDENVKFRVLIAEMQLRLTHLESLSPKV